MHCVSRSRHGMAQLDTARHSTFQRSTAQHSTAQHSTAPHRAVSMQTLLSGSACCKTICICSHLKMGEEAEGWQGHAWQ